MSPAGHGEGYDEAWRNVATTGYALAAVGYSAESLSEGMTSARGLTRLGGGVAYALAAVAEKLHGSRHGEAVMALARTALLAFACAVVALESDYLAGAAAAGQALMLAGHPLLAGGMLVAYYAGRTQEHAKQTVSGDAVAVDSVMTCSHVLLGTAYARELAKALSEPRETPPEKAH